MGPGESIDYCQTVTEGCNDRRCTEDAGNEARKHRITETRSGVQDSLTGDDD